MRQILVVDDSEIMHSFMRLLLTRMKDYKVRFLKNGQEALEAIGAHGEPSLILLDINSRLAAHDPLLIQQHHALLHTRAIPTVPRHSFNYST